MAKFAPVFEQGTSVDAGTTTSTPLAYSTNVRAFSLLTCEIGYDNASSSVSTVTDTQGNTWTRAKWQGGNGTSAEVWWAIAGTTGANTVTVTYSASRANRVAIQEWSKARDAVVFATNGNSDSATSHSHGSVTITTTPALVIAAYQVSGASDYGSGPLLFTLRVEDQNSLYVHDRVTSTQPVITTCPFSTAVSEQGSGAIVAFVKGPLPPSGAPDGHEEAVEVTESVAAVLVGSDAYWYDGFETVSVSGETAISQFWFQGLPANFGPTVGPPGTHYQNVTVVDAVSTLIINVGVTVLNVNKSDSITVTDAVQTRTLGYLRVNVNDAVTIAEFTRESASLVVKADDDITVTDVVTAQLRPTLRALGADAITVVDAPRVGLSLGVRVNDAVTVAEATALSAATAKTAQDAITVVDVAKVVVTPSIQRVHDRVTVTDGRTGSLSGPLTVFVFDTTTVVTGAFNPKIVLNTIVIDSDLSPTPFTAGDYWVVGI